MGHERLGSGPESLSKDVRENVKITAGKVYTGATVFNKFSGDPDVKIKLPLGTRGRYVVVFLFIRFSDLLVASARKKGKKIKQNFELRAEEM